jgi:hypothetical protein
MCKGFKKLLVTVEFLKLKVFCLLCVFNPNPLKRGYNRVGRDERVEVVGGLKEFGFGCVVFYLFFNPNPLKKGL